MKFIKNLNEIRKNDLKIAGGKAANIGEMIRIGLPVPEGFVILTNAYIEFIKENNLDEKIKKLLKNIKNDSKKLELISKKIKILFEKEKIPTKIKFEIKKAYESLKNESLVVRSSATAEDLPGLSFAGQYNTYLNINGYLSLEKHIKKCWASLWNSRAISYRIQQKINDTELAHGVVVQKLINSKKSGILFTANPLNGKRDEILINSSWGLGEAIVGGEVNPDQWVINKKTEKIIDEKIASKELMSVRKKEGIDLVKVNPSLKNKKTLNKNEIKKLLELAVKTEKYYNCPQDLEWAFDKKFYLVQTRPITSIYPLPKKEKEGLRIYLNINNYSQAMKEPFTPLGEDLITTSLKNIMSQFGRRKLKENSLWWYNIVGGRIFIDITAFLRKEKILNKFKKKNSNDKDPITTKILLQVSQKNKKELLSKKEKIKFKKLINLRMLRFILSAGSKYIYGIFYPIEARKKSEQIRINIISKLKKESLKQKTIENKINFIKKNISNLLIAGATTLFYVSVSSTYIEKTKKEMKKYLGSCKELELVEKSIPHSKTTEMGIELLNLAKYYNETKKKPKINDEKIQKFLDFYGHKKTVELDIGTPVWEEEPKYVIDLIKSYMKNKVYEKKLLEFNENEKKAIQAIENIKKRFQDKGLKNKGKKVANMLYGFREMFGMREESKFTITQGLLIFRKLMLEVGNELVKENKINNNEDIFFLKFEEIMLNNNLKKIVEKNKEEYFLNSKLNAPRVLLSTGESLYSNTTTKKENEIKGVPVSPGICEGIVRILETPEKGNKLKKGEILVTTGTNPAWTPLFLKINGLIMETGGPISHGSVVAREYGIPAITGITNATKELKTGQKIKMNGETGIIQIIDKRE